MSDAASWGSTPIARHSLQSSVIGEPFDRIAPTLEGFLSGEREVNVTVPARLHTSVIDMNGVNPGRPGGGIGCAMQVCRGARVRTAKEPEVFAIGHRSPPMRHYGRLFQQLLGYGRGFEIELHDPERRHRRGRAGRPLPPQPPRRRQAS